MNNKFQVPKIFENIVPFIIAGIAIALFVGLLFMFSYVVIWGLIIGAILWLITLIKQFIIPNSTPKSKTSSQSTGRIIEHDDKK